jgi:hypothetical protein
MKGSLPIWTILQTLGRKQALVIIWLLSELFLRGFVLALP